MIAQRFVKDLEAYFHLLCVCVCLSVPDNTLLVSTAVLLDSSYVVYFV